jgi:phosphoglycerate dehydrogenase-like enzyme
MVTPGVNRPFISNTANVVRSPEIIFRGTSRIRAFFAAGAGCSSVIARAPKHQVVTVSNAANKTIRRFIKAMIEEPC